jgi:superfamily II DNA/RNA helicase
VPITVSTEVSTSRADTPVVSVDLVVHLPEEIVAAAVAAERAERRVVVCCRESSQAEALGAQLLLAGVGSAVVTAATPVTELADTLQAFGFNDFTVLLVTDDLNYPWAAPEGTALMHADLPALYSGPLLLVAWRARLRPATSSGEGLLEAHLRQLA